MKVLSNLQKEILRTLNEKQNIDYNFLVNTLNRDRITIFKSIESLIREGFIQKEKINPEYEKSRLVFKTTLKGEVYYGFREIYDLSESEQFKLINNVEDYEPFKYYLKFIEDVKDKNHRLKLLQSIFSYVGGSYYSEADQKSINYSEFESIKKGFKKSLLYLMEDKKFNSDLLFNKRSLGWFKKIFTENEIEDFKSDLKIIEYNISNTLKKFT